MAGKLEVLLEVRSNFHAGVDDDVDDGRRMRLIRALNCGAQCYRGSRSLRSGPGQSGEYIQKCS